MSYKQRIIDNPSKHEKFVLTVANMQRSNDADDAMTTINRLIQEARKLIR